MTPKTFVYIVIGAWSRGDFTEEWIVGVFFSKDRADDCVQQLERKPESCDHAYVIPEEVLDAHIGVA